MKSLLLFAFLSVASHSIAQQPARLFERTFDFENGNLISSSNEQCSLPDSLNPYKYQLGMKTLKAFDGTFYEVYCNYYAPSEIRNVYLRTSSDGLSWSVPMEVAASAGNTRLEANISIAQTEAGPVMVIGWIEYDGASVPSFWMVSSEDLGQTFSEPVQITNASGYQYLQSSIAVDEAGTIYAVWCKYNGWWQILYFSKSENNGQTWTPETTIYNGLQYSSQPVIETRGTGEAMVTMLDDQFFHANCRIVKTVDSGQTWTTSQSTNYTTETGDTHWSTLDFAPDGDVFVIDWFYNGQNSIEAYKVECARSADFGTSWDAPVKVSDDVILYNVWGSAQGSAATIMGMDISENNVVYVTWADARNDYPADLKHDVFLSWSTDDGATWSTDIMVNQDTTAVSHLYPAVAVISDGSNDHVLITWLDTRCFVPQITQVGNVMTSTVADSYQWYFNGNLIDGATSQSYEGTQAGTYTVEVFNGPCTASSQQYGFELVGVEEREKNHVSIYPNPSSGFINISALETIKRVEIFDALGQKVLSVGAMNVFSHQLDISSLAVGTYIIYTHTGNNRYVTSLLKK